MKSVKSLLCVSLFALGLCSAIAPPTASAQEQFGASYLTGRWQWFFNGDVYFNANGTFSQPAAKLHGTWTYQDDGQVVMRWSHGYTDYLRLNRTSDRLEGRGFPGGHRVWGVRNDGFE